MSPGTGSIDTARDDTCCHGSSRGRRWASPKLLLTSSSYEYVVVWATRYLIEPPLRRRRSSRGDPHDLGQRQRGERLRLRSGREVQVHDRVAQSVQLRV